MQLVRNGRFVDIATLIWRCRRVSLSTIDESALHSGIAADICDDVLHPGNLGV